MITRTASKGLLVKANTQPRFIVPAAFQIKLFLRQHADFIALRFRGRVPSAQDLSKERDRQRVHQSGGVADLARIFERPFCVSEGGDGIAEHP